jgi:hypothetical protein
MVLKRFGNTLWNAIENWEFFPVAGDFFGAHCSSSLSLPSYSGLNVPPSDAHTTRHLTTRHLTARHLTTRHSDNSPLWQLATWQLATLTTRHHYNSSPLQLVTMAYMPGSVSQFWLFFTSMFALYTAPQIFHSIFCIFLVLINEISCHTICL